MILDESKSTSTTEFQALTKSCFNRFPFSGVTNMIKRVLGPKYDGKYLHGVLKERLGYTRLHQTLTNVVIPTFDIKKLQPVIFSSYEVGLEVSSTIYSMSWDIVRRGEFTSTDFCLR